MYKPQTSPLARVVQGAPTSWDPSIANTRFPSTIDTAAWSPCSKFIAITLDGSIEVLVLDAVTLKPLHTMHPRQYITWHNLIFSPDGYLLTGYSLWNHWIFSWDLQTGGLISKINTKELGICNSMAYSECGTKLGGLFSRSILVTYDILSCTQISSHPVQKCIADTIWTHDECLQFATMESKSITIWEVSFTLSHAPVQVNSLPVPENFSEEGLALLPTLSQFAFICERRILVWDAQHHKILLDSIDVKDPKNITFSPNGHFFVCGTEGSEIYLWKESPNGYLLHQKFISNTQCAKPVVSPNGQSIISFGGLILQLWNATNSSASLPGISSVSQHTKNFILEFSPDESWVALTQQSGKTVTALDVKSGNSQLVIDMDTEICGVSVTESRIIAVGDGKVVAWELPEGNCVFNAQGSINSVQTTTFKHSVPIRGQYVSISPDLDYIVIGESGDPDEAGLCIYNRHTGKELAVVKSEGYLPGFTLDGNRVWFAAADGRVNQWLVDKNNVFSTAKLKSLGDVEEPLSGFPWHSSCGYQITDEGWILNSSGKQLLWLPYQWRSANKPGRRWSGNFLALLQSGLPEAVILELEV